VPIVVLSPADAAAAAAALGALPDDGDLRAPPTPAPPSSSPPPQHLSNTSGLATGELEDESVLLKERKERDWSRSAIVGKSKQKEKLLDMLNRKIEKLSTVRWLPKAAGPRRDVLIRIHRGATCPLPGPFVGLLQNRGITDPGILQEAADIARENRGTMETAEPVPRSRIGIPYSYRWNYAICADCFVLPRSCLPGPYYAHPLRRTVIHYHCMALRWGEGGMLLDPAVLGRVTSIV
jgi:hypothetical protein